MQIAKNSRNVIETFKFKSVNFLAGGKNFEWRLRWWPAPKRYFWQRKLVTSALSAPKNAILPAPANAFCNSGCSIPRIAFFCEIFFFSKC